MLPLCLDSDNLDELAGSEHDQTSDRDSVVGSKRKGGRPVDPAWGSFKRVANPNSGASNRAWIGVCNGLVQHDVGI